MPPIAPGVLFWPVVFAPDARWVAGTAVTAGQISEIDLWSIADRAYRKMPWKRDSLIDWNLAFVDRDHLVYGVGGELWLGDLRGGEPRRLHAAAPGHRLSNLSASRDGRTLTWIDIADESDIWLLSLDGASAGAAKAL